jgi:small subunit ribosomal protein S20
LAHTLSARKRWRQSLRRRERNRAVAGAAKTYVTSARSAIQAGDMGRAEGAVREAASALDRASQKGAVHPRNAARRKSRLMLSYNRTLASAPEEAPKPARGRRQTEPKAAKKPSAKGAPKAKKTTAKKATAKKTTAKKTTAKKTTKK